jgi:integrase/recombinase XerD
MVTYLDAAGIKPENEVWPLFRSTVRKTKQLTDKALNGEAICELRKRGSKLPERLSRNSIRLTSITDLLTQGEPLEYVQYLAGDNGARTTRLYDRRQKLVTRNIVEKISI